MGSNIDGSKGYYVALYTTAVTVGSLVRGRVVSGSKYIILYKTKYKTVVVSW